MVLTLFVSRGPEFWFLVSSIPKRIVYLTTSLFTSQNILGGSDGAPFGCGVGTRNFQISLEIIFNAVAELRMHTWSLLFRPQSRKQLMPRGYLVPGLCDVTIQNIELRVPIQFDFCQSFTTLSRSIASGHGKFDETITKLG